MDQRCPVYGHQAGAGRPPAQGPGQRPAGFRAVSRWADDSGAVCRCGTWGRTLLLLVNSSTSRSSGRYRRQPGKVRQADRGGDRCQYIDSQAGASCPAEGADRNGDHLVGPSDDTISIRGTPRCPPSQNSAWEKRLTEKQKAKNHDPVPDGLCSPPLKSGQNNSGALQALTGKKDVSMTNLPTPVSTCSQFSDDEPYDGFDLFVAEATAAEMIAAARGISDEELEDNFV